MNLAKVIEQAAQIAEILDGVEHRAPVGEPPNMLLVTPEELQKIHQASSTIRREVEVQRRRRV